MKRGDELILTIAERIGYAYGLAGGAITMDGKSVTILSEIADMIGVVDPENVISAGIEAGNTLGLLRHSKGQVKIGSGDNWSPFMELPKRTTIPTITGDLLPMRLSPWIRDIAKQKSTAIEMVAIPAIVGLSSLIGRHLRIRPDTHSMWSTPPNLWGAIVGTSGLMKTPTISAAISPIRQFAREERERCDGTRDMVEVQHEILEAKLATLKRQKLIDPDEIVDIKARIAECEVDERRYISNDPTVEKLGELLKRNSRGILLVRDELSGWLENLTKKGREGDREFYLESWNGDGEYTIDRIGRGTVHISGMCLSILGGIQPSKISRLVSKNRDGGDGLLQRFQLLVWPDRLPKWKQSTDEPDKKAQQEAYRCYKDVDRKCSELIDEPIRLDRYAQDEYNEWRNSLEVRLRSGKLDEQPEFESHLSKYRGLVPSLACIYWVSDGYYPPDRVSAGYILQAIALVDYLEMHAKKLYGATGDSVSEGARILAEKIRSGAIEHGQAVRDIYRSRWKDLENTTIVGDALRDLEDHGWIRCVREPSVRGRVIHLHPVLRVR